MAIYVKTSSPAVLLKEIKEQINNGMIDTWSVDNDGDFTHDVEQWRFHAWLRPIIETDRLVFGILCRNDRSITTTEYAIYHGRFVEMILAHFDKMCVNVMVTAMPTTYDKVNHNS